MGEPRYSIEGFLKFFKSKLRGKGEPGKGEPGKDEPPKFQEFHMVVAALIAAVTFQACVNPPGGVWQDDKYLDEANKSELIHEAGRAVYAEDKKAFYVFLAFNTLALSSSMCLLICLTWRYPFFLMVAIAMASMGVTYGASIFAITPTDYEVAYWLLFIAAVPVIVSPPVLICEYVMSEKKNQARTLGS